MKSTNSRVRRWAMPWIALVALVVWLLAGAPPIRTRHGEIAEPRVLSGDSAEWVGGDLRGMLWRWTGPSFRGKVASKLGEPLEGANVCATLAGAAAWMDAQSTCVRSEQDGGYALRVPPGAYALTAELAGFVPQAYAGGVAVVFSGLEGREAMDFALEPGGAVLQGRVLDAMGGPVPEADVTLFQLQPAQLTLSMRADEEGQFRTSVQQGAVVVLARAPGYAAQRISAVAPSRVELQLVAAGTIAGRVFTAAEREPEADIEVRAMSLGSSSLPTGPSGVSDADGRFEISGIGAGRYWLRAQGGAYQGRSLQPISLPLGGRVEEAVVLLQRGTELTGTVRSQTGTPCSRGYVALGTPDPTLPPSAVRAYVSEEVGPTQQAAIQGDGSVTFAGVPEGFYHVTVLCIGHVLEEGPRVLRVGGGSMPALNWVVSEGGALQVHVVDGSGRPVPNVRFGVEMPGDPGTSGRTMPMRTDPNGDAVVPGLRAGTYRLHPPADHEAEPVSVRIGSGERREATLKLKASGAIDVVVQNPGGEPVDGLQVLARSTDESSQPVRRERARAMGDGHYFVGPLAKGDYRVWTEDGVNPLDATSSTVREVRVSEGAHTKIVLTLPPTTKLAGRVVSAEGAPMANVWVSASASSHEGEDARSRAGRSDKRTLTDFEGLFQLDGLASGARFDLRAEDPEGAVAVTRDVLAGTQRLEIRLPETCSLRGVVVDSEGQPVTEYQLRAFTEGILSEHTQLVMHGGGAFEAVQVTPGEITVTAMTRHAHGTATGLTLAPSERKEGIRIVLQDSRTTSAK